MKKPSTKTKKRNNKEATISNNNQNVTVGTLADALHKSETQKGRYIYCDFAQIEEEEYDVDYEIDQEGLLQALDESTTMAAAQTVQHQSISYLEQPPPVLRASGWVRSQRFPTKLYALLSQPQLSTIISWMPHGRSWKVLKPRVFETSVLPVFFESDNYHSFNRVINAWSFRRKSSGPDRGSYFHELFLRGKPLLQKYMRRLPRTHKKLVMSKIEEPDFFELEKTSQLPTLEEALVNLHSRKLNRLREHFDKETNHPNINNNSITGHEHNVLDAQTKQRQDLKHVETWHDDHGSNLSPPQTLSGTRKQVPKDTGAIKDVDGYNRHRIYRTTKDLEVPESLFRMQEDEIKDDFEPKSYVPRNNLVKELSQQQQQGQAHALRQVQAEAVMMRQMEQEQYLRAFHQQQQQQQNKMISQADLLRQMDILQASQQQNGF
mmetsp:Transcript_43781/g.49054  ORF Transcript_43781/g.49054 Transcript_43781/m.49054 type:complete len:434 (+) Transcript_43781:52-1353(+)